MRVLKMLEQLAGAADWRGVAAQERTARAVAAAVRTSMPSIASFVYSILGRAHQNLGSFFKALEYHAQDLSIAKEVGDRAGEGNAKGNLGIAYQSQGDFSKAIEHYTQCLAIAKEVGNRAGEGMAYRNLGTGHMQLNKYVKAVAYFEAQHALALSLKLAHVQSDAALNTGVALTLSVRAARQGTAAGADQAPGPHSRSSACLNDGVREAAKWLQAAFDGGRPFANLLLAHLTFYAGQEDAALAHLKEHLSWRTQRSSIDMYNNDVGQESAQKFMKQTGDLKAATLYFAS